MYTFGIKLMALRTLKITTLEQNGLARLKELEPSIDTTVYGSVVTNLIRSLAITAFPVTFLARDVLDDAFPKTAQGEALDNIGRDSGVERKLASQSSGQALLIGSVGQLVDAGEEYSTGAVDVYTESPITLDNITYNVTNVATANGILTVTFGTIHSLSKGVKVTLSGLVNSALNGQNEVTGIVSSTAVTFKTTSQLAFSGVSGGTASLIGGLVGIKSIGSGISQNVISDIKLSGDNEAYVTYNGLTGASDAESDDAYRQRIIDARNILDGVFTAPQVRNACLSIEGNTRAWVVSPQYLVFGGTEGQAGYKPQPGQVVCYVIRDNDANPIPSQTVLNATKQAVIDLGKMPVHTVPEDIFVFAPNLEAVNIKVGALVPNVASLKSAIENELKAFINDYLDLGQSLTNNQIISVIQSTVDAQGNTPKTFALLSAPLVIDSSSLVAFGGVTWS
jgi:uncharacterized phage protein gp47/JayE